MAEIFSSGEAPGHSPRGIVPQTWTGCDLPQSLTLARLLRCSRVEGSWIAAQNYKEVRP